MNIGTKAEWGEVERRAHRHEASVSALMEAAGLPPLKITVSDRLRGALVSAISEIEVGHYNTARQTLLDALKLV